MAMNRAPRLVNTGDHVILSRGYPGLRVAVTYEDDPGWMHETLMLWVVEPDKFVVLTPGDMYEEMRETWRSAQIVTGRRRLPQRTSECGCFSRSHGRHRNDPTHH